MLVVLGCLFHLPWIDRPFGGNEPNPAIYYGTYARNYERLGLLETRGSQLGPCLLEDISQGRINLRHPPGVSWLFWAFGTAEWQIRLVTVLGSLAAAILLYLFLVSMFGHWASLFGATVFLLSPNVAHYSQGSVEDILIPIGLALLLALRLRPTGSRAILGAVVAGTAAIGPWFDWEFAFFCAAGVSICWSHRVVETIRRLALPAIVAAGSLALILVWRAWACAAPGLADLPDNTGLGDLVAAFVLDRPPLLEFVQSKATFATKSLTPTLVVLMILGIGPFFRRDPKLAVALTMIGLLPIIMFATHEDWVFYTFLVPLASASATALFAAARWVPTRVRVAVALAVVAVLAAATWRITAASSTTLFRDAGRIMSAAARGDDGGEQPKAYRVVHNLGLQYYGYYVDSRYVVFRGFADPILLARERARSDEFGLRFLWLRGANLPAQPGLAEFLQQFPMRRVPELEVTLETWGIEVAIDQVWMVTLREPR